MTVYLDNDFKCHVESAEGLIPYETDYFNGREELIPLYRIVPDGLTWTRPKDGMIFYGEMITLI